MSKIDYIPHYCIGHLLGEPIYLPRCAALYEGFNINSSWVVWRDDCRAVPVLISIQHSLRLYIQDVCNHSILKPDRNLSATPSWVENEASYSHKNHFYQLYLKKFNPSTEHYMSFEDWVQCSIAEMIIENYPEIIKYFPDECLALMNYPAQFKMEHATPCNLMQCGPEVVTLLTIDRKLSDE